MGHGMQDLRIGLRHLLCQMGQHTAHLARWRLKLSNVRSPKSPTSGLSVSKNAERHLQLPRYLNCPH